MTRRHWMISILFGVLFLLVIAAVSFPDMFVRRILFVSVIGVGIIVVIAWIFKVEADRADMAGALEVQAVLIREMDKALADEIKEMRRSEAELRRLTYRHVGVCIAQQIDDGIDVDGALREFLAESESRET